MDDKELREKFVGKFVFIDYKLIDGRTNNFYGVVQKAENGKLHIISIKKDQSAIIDFDCIISIRSQEFKRPVGWNDE